MQPQASYKYIIICHLFYEDESMDTLHQLLGIKEYSTLFMFNIHPANNKSRELEEFIKKRFKKNIILSIPQKGRDIGAKLQLINLFLQLEIQSDYTLIIHDKKSPHLENGKSWRSELFKIAEPAYLAKITALFEKEPSVGLIGSAKYVQNEYVEKSNVFSCSSNNQLKELMEKYKIYTADHDFIAGNMFWIRTDLLKKFFEKRSILKIREELEPGNALDFNKGTYIHAWERLMSWIATSQGSKIYGI